MHYSDKNAVAYAPIHTHACTHTSKYISYYDKSKSCLSVLS